MTESIERPGIYHGMSAADYFADPCPQPSLTQSIAKLLIDRSPLHAWHAHPRLGGAGEREREDYTAALAIGNAAHKLLLGRGKDVVIIEADSFRTKEAQAARDAVAARGKVPILAKHHHRAAAMVQVAKEQLAQLVVGAIDGGDSEVVLAWQEDGLWFRSMLDWFTIPAGRTRVVDYKTSGMSCAPHAIGRMLADAGWDVQAAMHERGLDALDPDGAGRRQHLFIAQENEEPYALTVCELGKSVRTMGHKKLEFATAIWRHCLANNDWPGYPSEIVRPELPGWAEQQWLDREIGAAALARMPAAADSLMGG
jgi:PDDEXK-like domain of unknown function (DUF3799)